MLRRIVMILLVSFLLAPVHAMATDVLSADISGKEWTWIPGELAVFEGTVVYEGNADETPLTLALSLECEPSVADTGDIVFATVNDQKLSRMKQKSQYVIRKDENRVFRFTGHWIIPDGAFLQEVRVILTVYDQDGQKLAEASFREDDGTENETVSASFRFPDLKRCISLLLIAAGGIWLFAIIRIIHNRRRGE